MRRDLDHHSGGHGRRGRGQPQQQHRHVRLLSTPALLAVGLLMLARGVQGMVQHFHYEEETSPIFQLEAFGFRQGGVMELNFNHFSIKTQPGMEDDPVRAGFLMHRTDSETTARQSIEAALERLGQDRDDCWLDHPGPKDEVIDMSDPGTWSMQEKRHQIADGEEGLYSLVFIRCRPPASAVSFRMDARFYNPGPNFLPAGEAPLPALYFLFFFCYALALGSWALTLRKRRQHVHSIHHMMAALLFFKTLSLLFEAVRYHVYQVKGAAEGWSIIYYIFAFMKGTMRFVVVLLIGSGWTLLKPYLNDKEKRIVLVVLALQVIDNIAMVVLEELSQTSPGSLRWLTWRDIFHLVDIACCCAILFPIVWSIRHLRQAAAADGKTAATLQKLQLFRSFYLMVVAYIYFTRIVVALIEATLPYDLLWLQQLFDEGATLAFYLVTGYKFRPADANPYFALRAGNEREAAMAELEEFGLDDIDEEDEDTFDDSGVEMGGRGGGNGGRTGNHQIHGGSSIVSV